MSTSLGDSRIASRTRSQRYRARGDVMVGTIARAVTLRKILASMPVARWGCNPRGVCYVPVTMAIKQVKPPTPQSVSAALGRAGFEKTATEKSRGRLGAVYLDSEGFSVEASMFEKGMVCVTHVVGRRGDTSIEYTTAVLTRYAMALPMYATSINLRKWEDRGMVRYSHRLEVTALP